VADVPDTLVLKRHRDLVGRTRFVWIRRALLLIPLAAVVLGLLNVFGQRPRSTKAANAQASLTVYSPDRVRGGLLYTTRFHVVARQELKDAMLVLDPGWIEGMQVNSVNPQPTSEASRDGRLSFDLGHVPAGESFLLFIEFQVDPTNVGWHRPQNVELDDGQQKILTVHRSVTVFP
jgi:hypothetical protein